MREPVEHTHHEPTEIRPDEVPEPYRRAVSDSVREMARDAGVPVDLLVQPWAKRPPVLGPPPPIPDWIRVGPHTFEIRHDPDTARLLRDDDSRGDTYTEALMIRLDDRNPSTVVAETLLHELMHAAWYVTALRAVENPDEEAVCQALAPVLLGILRDSPELVAYLTAEVSS